MQPGVSIIYTLSYDIAVCRTSKELYPQDDVQVVTMKAIIDTDVAVIGLVIVHCILHI